MTLILTDPETKTLVQGFTSLEPQAAFRLFGFLEVDRCLAPMTGIDKAMLNLLFIGLFMTSYLVIFSISFFWLRAVTHRKQSILKIHSKLPTFLRHKTLADIKSSGFDLLLFVLEPLFAAIISIFDCKKASIDGKEMLFLNGYGDTECWQGTHIGLAIFSAILGIIVLIVLPIFVYRLISSRYENGKTAGLGIALVSAQH
jgi:uncharacterized membrane protein